MPSYIMVVLTKPTEGQDAQYNDWYTNTHIPEVCDIPGITAGERWKVVPEFCMSQPPRPYLAIYEIEADDAGSVMQELMRRAESGEMQMSDALDLESAMYWIYEKI